LFRSRNEKAPFRGRGGISRHGADAVIRSIGWVTTRIQRTFFARMIHRRQRRLSRSCPTLSEALDRYLDEVSARKKSGYQEQSIARAWRDTLLISRSL